MSRIILASASPRRRALLEALGVDFDIVVSDADEEKVPRDLPVELYVQELALLKAAAVAKIMLKKRDAVIVAADTIVTLDDKILGKPKDESDAARILRSLSGRGHAVYTGYCVMRTRDGKTVCDRVRTSVEFKELTDEKIAKYIKSGEPMDKAGAYGIQGLGSMLISGIKGDYFNVVGLPVSALSNTLENEFDIRIL